MESFDFALDPELYEPVASTSSYKEPQQTQFASESEESESDENEISGGDDSQEEETDAEDEYNNTIGRNDLVKRKKLDRKEKGKGIESQEVGSQGVDAEDEDALNRLISAIRDDGPLGGRTALGKEYGRTIDEGFDEFDEPLIMATKSRRRRRRRGANAGEESTEQIKKMLGNANDYYANGDYEPAEEILTEIIRISPHLRQPWYTLATIYEDRGDEEKSIMFKIVATHLSSAKVAAKEWASLGCQSRDIGLLQQAVYCFTLAIRGDKTDVDSMWDRAILLKLSHNSKESVAAFEALLKVHPHDPGVLRELVPLLAAADLLEKAVKLYSGAFEYFQKAVPHYTSPEEISTFAEEDLDSLAHLLILQGKADIAIKVVKQGQRWLQGRERQTGWDVLLDDREYDRVRKVRKNWEKDAKHLEEAPLNPLNLRLRLRLGVARLNMGRLSEAQKHFDVILDEPVDEQPELFGLIAEAFIAKSMWDEATEILGHLVQHEDTNLPHIWYKIGMCHKETGNYEPAVECLEQVLTDEPDNIDAKILLANVYEAMMDRPRAWKLFNEVREARGRLRDADFDGVLEFDGLGQQKKVPRKSKERRAAQSKAEKQAAAEETESREQQLATEYLMAFTKLDSLYQHSFDDVGDCRLEWLSVATLMIDNFRETPQLFPTDKSKKFMGLSRKWKRKDAATDVDSLLDEMGNRLERSMRDNNGDIGIDTFCGALFDRWLDIIIKYAFLLTLNGEGDAAQETLAHVINASPFVQSETRSLSLKLARCACYVRVSDYQGVITIARSIWQRYQFQTDPLRLLQALVPGGFNAIKASHLNTLQKYSIRQINTVNRIVNGEVVKVKQLQPAIKAKITKAKTPKKKVVLEDDDQEMDHEDEEDGDYGDDDEAVEESRIDAFKPTKLNPVYIISHSCMLLSSKSYSPAINYLLQALPIAASHPLLHFLLGVAYLHRACQRQTDNRHYQIIEAAAFFDKYRAIKGDCQEVEYNFGRMFQQLHLNGLAINHYKKVLKLSEESKLNQMEIDDESDFTGFSAYNLMILHAMEGDSDLAGAVSKKWLSV